MAEVETDKAVVEMPSPVAGTILKLYRQEGETVKVGEVLATIGAAGGGRSHGCTSGGHSCWRREAAVGLGGRRAARERDADLERAKRDRRSERRHCRGQPAVRKLAKDLSVDLAAVKGTGPSGRVTEEDVRDLGKQSASASRRRSPSSTSMAGSTGCRCKGIRRTTAKQMMESTIKAAQVTTMEQADVTELFVLRERVKGWPWSSARSRSPSAVHRQGGDHGPEEQPLSQFQHR